MTIKESIEKLGKKLTGKDIYGTSISDVVSKVSDNFEGGTVGDGIIESAKATGGIGWTVKGKRTKIEWDGNTDGKQPLTEGIPVYRVADESVSPSELVGAIVSDSNGIKYTISENDINDVIPDIVYMALSERIYVVTQDFHMDEKGESYTFYKGIYFLADSGQYIASLEFGEPDEVHKIDKRYLTQPYDMFVELTENDLGKITANVDTDKLFEASTNGEKILVLFEPHSEALKQIGYLKYYEDNDVLSVSYSDQSIMDYTEYMTVQIYTYTITILRDGTITKDTSYITLINENV